jgi:hypothetical protein
MVNVSESSAAEKERLRFEGDLDKWMKIIGAGITGYQPEAYAMMDWSCHELVRLRETRETLVHALTLFVRAEKMARDGNPPQDADRLIEIGEEAISKAEIRS